MPGKDVVARRVNIQIRDDTDPANALACVSAVVRNGRISGDGKYYCWLTRFSDGTVVCVRGPNKAVNSDSFVVYKEKIDGDEESNKEAPTKPAGSDGGNTQPCG